ncbi:hypothetical protein FC093_10980 [Ilyomonas limi]|uniref:Uncharacterized protein n=1 Tax=Ilyomonas limi TaxID=2575867 RepID=A0A4U3L1H3_9BACT|nr:hypothetical protein [Ilyomonas limi]TKK68632.1 hypothetical protein FC093_10980 [Ilyomonas limi]
MKNDYKDRRQKSFSQLRMVYNISMGILILAMAVVMLFSDKLGIDAIDQFVSPIDPVLRYLFGGLCLLYGFFRLYRGFKKEY